MAVYCPEMPVGPTDALDGHKREILDRDAARATGGTPIKPPAEINYGYGPDGPNFDVAGTHPATEEDLQRLGEAGDLPPEVLNYDKDPTA